MAAGVEVPTRARPRVERHGSRAGRAVRLGVAVAGGLAVALGVALRIWAIGRAPMNSDEAVVGLMAHEILAGHFFAFYWGQHYGGVEPYLTAVLFGLFGQSSVTLDLTPTLLDVAACVLVWRIGRRLFSPAAGAAAGVLFFVWPEVYVWQSTIEYGFRWAALVLGLSMLLLVLRITDDPPVPRSRWVALRDWVLLGACAGLGWWATPEIAYYALPSAALLVGAAVRRGLRPRPGHLAAGAVAAVAGALPWLWDNVGHGFPSLHSTPQGPGNSGFVHHLHIFVSKVAPILLGLKLRVSGAWVVQADAAKALYVLAVLAGVAYLVLLVVRRQALVLVLFLVLAPLIYAYSPFTWWWEDGRYAIFLAPVIALVAVAAAQQALGLLPLRRVPVLPRVELQRLGGPVLVVLAGVALTLGAVGRLDPYRPSLAAGRTGWFSLQSNPDSYLLPTLTALEQDGVSGAYVGYWVAYDLAFQAQGRVAVSDVTFARYAPYLSEVEAAPRSAWLFPSPAGLPQLEAETGTPLLEPGCIGGVSVTPGASSCLSEPQLEAYLRSVGDPYRRLGAGDFVAVVPSRPVNPFAVLHSAGIKLG